LSRCRESPRPGCPAGRAAARRRIAAADLWPCGQPSAHGPDL